MKNIGCVLMFVHVIALGSLAKILVQEQKWPTVGAIAFWVVVSACGLFPILRTLVLFGMLFAMLTWWKAFVVGLVATAVLIGLESFGKNAMTRRD